MKTFLMITVLVASLLTLGCNSVPSFEEPIAVANASYLAMNAGDWSAYAGTMHPDALLEYQNLVLPALMGLAPKDSTGAPIDSFAILGGYHQSAEFFSQPAESLLVDIMQGVYAVSPEMAQAFSGLTFEVVGGIEEGEDVCHILARTRWALGGRQTTEMSVVTLKKQNGEWKQMLSVQVKGVAEMLLQAVYMQRG